jgi:hypothetical protein
MIFQELQQTIESLSIEERLLLLSTIAQSVQRDLQPRKAIDKQAIVAQLRDCLKQPGKSAPTDEDIEAMREERLTEKYLK